LSIGFDKVFKRIFCQKIEDLERLNTQAVKLVERYRTKLDTAVDTRLITAFQALNETGREEAVKRVQELAELERYKK
jgi:hypothetical protein